MAESKANGQEVSEGLNVAETHEYERLALENLFHPAQVAYVDMKACGILHPEVEARGLRLVTLVKYALPDAPTTHVVHEMTRSPHLSEVILWRTTVGTAIHAVFKRAAAYPPLMCAGKNRKGKPCGNRAHITSAYCWNHAPTRPMEADVRDNHTALIMPAVEATLKVLLDEIMRNLCIYIRKNATEIVLATAEDVLPYVRETGARFLEAKALYKEGRANGYKTMTSEYIFSINEGVRALNRRHQAMDTFSSRMFESLLKQFIGSQRLFSHANQVKFMEKQLLVSQVLLNLDVYFGTDVTTVILNYADHEGRELLTKKKPLKFFDAWYRPGEEWRLLIDADMGLPSSRMVAQGLFRNGVTPRFMAMTTTEAVVYDVRIEKESPSCMECDESIWRGGYECSTCGVIYCVECIAKSHREGMINFEAQSDEMERWLTQHSRSPWLQTPKPSTFRELPLSNLEEEFLAHIRKGTAGTLLASEIHGHPVKYTELKHGKFHTPPSLADLVHKSYAGRRLTDTQAAVTVGTDAVNYVDQILGLVRLSRVSFRRVARHGETPGLAVSVSILPGRVDRDGCEGQYGRAVRAAHEQLERQSIHWRGTFTEDVYRLIRAVCDDNHILPWFERSSLDFDTSFGDFNSLNPDALKPSVLLTTWDTLYNLG